MKILRYNILRSIYGTKIIEAFTLDMLLSALEDGVPHDYKTFVTPTGDISTWDITRKTDKLIEDGMVKVNHNWVVITSKGALHLSKGGYTDEIKRHKRASFSFWLSIFAVVVSLSSLFLTWLNRRP